jgi:glucuronoarabinoxylan endo-1,4-beta-xylanase
MQGTIVGKKYYASKHFYRYIRPGAARVKAVASDPKLFVTAYQHIAKATQTIVIINSDEKAKQVYLSGAGLLNSFQMYRTSETTENCALINTVKIGAVNSFVIPAKSIVTLQAGGDAL